MLYLRDVSEVWAVNGQQDRQTGGGFLTPGHFVSLEVRQGHRCPLHCTILSLIKHYST